MSSEMNKFTYRYTFFLLNGLFLLSTSPSLFSHATDTLTQGQSIKDGQTLLSAAEIFELGFFTPGNSTYRYVGIWYWNISTQSVVWVANRETPLTSSDGSLTIGNDGNLCVLDGSGSTVWSTNTSTTSNGSNTAQLSDSGELRLRSGNGTVIWDSFEHPTDTFLPGMKVSWNKKTGERTLFRSWKTPSDPSAGEYSLGIDPGGSGQIYIWKGADPWWRSGQWDGTTFIGSTMRALYLYGFKPVNDLQNSGLFYFSYESFNNSLLRFVVQWDGVENTSILVDETRDWASVWVQPSNECETYGKCGNNAICSESAEPICSCLKGFEPASVEEWTNGNWSAGCVRRATLGCETLNSSTSSSEGGEKGDGFFRVGGLKVPDFSYWASTVVNAADCATACSTNCSCKAYAYVAGIGCLVWTGHDLIDIYEFPQGTNGHDLYIKLAASELGTKSEKWKTIVIILCTLVVIVLISCIFLWWKFNPKIQDWWKKNRKKETFSTSTLQSTAGGKIDFSGPSDHAEEGQEGTGVELPLFNFDSVAIATDNFSDSNKLGEGGFGHVYKGRLPGGEEVAVKRLSRSSGQGQEEFKNEMILIAKLQHRNLVRLLGCCIQGEEKILIYEYMPNKSLDAFLFDPQKQQSLDWTKRFDIVDGIARGLVYLHRDSRLRIVHRDLKASNILLDHDMNPKISDFGMARIFGSNQNQANTNRVVGTFGYMSPEYAMEGLFSVKSDVYSFGILVLEIVSGRKNSSFHKMEDAINIVGYAWKLWNEDRALELIDPVIQNSYSVRQALRCIRVALLCVQDRASDRPDMPSVVLMLGSETAMLPLPKQPTFISDGRPDETETIANNHESFSLNDVTITVLVGR